MLTSVIHYRCVFRSHDNQAFLSHTSHGSCCAGRVPPPKWEPKRFLFRMFLEVISNFWGRKTPNRGPTPPVVLESEAAMIQKDPKSLKLLHKPEQTLASCSLLHKLIISVLINLKPVNSCCCTHAVLDLSDTGTTAALSPLCCLPTEHVSDS